MSPPRLQPSSAGARRRAWLRGMLVLWLVDGVTILTACLSAPAELPLLRRRVRMG